MASNLNFHIAVFSCNDVDEIIIEIDLQHFFRKFYSNVMEV